jgi:spermidine synthase
MSEGSFVGEAVAAADACNWYSETQGDGLIMQFRVTSTLHRCQTKFQQVELLHTQAFGRCLLLDGQMQSSQLDEAMCVTFASECQTRYRIVTLEHVPRGAGAAGAVRAPAPV